VNGREIFINVPIIGHPRKYFHGNIYTWTFEFQCLFTMTYTEISKPLSKSYVTFRSCNISIGFVTILNFIEQRYTAYSVCKKLI